MKKFEYLSLEIPAGGFWGGKIDNQEMVIKLNELGEEGWEIITSLATSRHEGKTDAAIIIMKREINVY